MVCSIERCGAAVHGHGLCLRHYTRWRRHGDPLAGRRYFKGASVEERFWAYVRKNPGPRACWEWTGGVISTGYGKIHLAPGQAGMAHRFSYELHHGPIPAGLFVCHHCDNRKCVNPRHLFCGTQQDNVDDMEAKGRAVKHGSVGEANGGSRIMEANVRAIRASSATPKEIAEQYGISRSMVYAILSRRAWKHIK